MPYTRDETDGNEEIWQPVQYEINDAEKYLQTEGLNIHQCAKKIRALQAVLKAKREKFLDDYEWKFLDDNTYAESSCEVLEISFVLPRRIRRKHIFDDGSKDVQLSYEYDLRRTMFSSIDTVTAEIRERLNH
ncbi:uncharacterized protein TNCV_2195761 [Trichonephila clavipes]|nr:uncharacterized protein TNCV_2195761 [Trichonephila clavipes]